MHSHIHTEKMGYVPFTCFVNKNIEKFCADASGAPLTSLLQGLHLPSLATCWGHAHWIIIIFQDLIIWFEIKVCLIGTMHTRKSNKDSCWQFGFLASTGLHWLINHVEVMGEREILNKSYKCI